ncbi:MAG: hypothetical protein ACXAC5_08080 [Promethearchaeota archaeon]|jgi:hypothetical protein
MIRGITISVLITSASYIIVSIISIMVGFDFSGLYLFADIHFVLGTIVGVIITLNNREEHHSILKSGAFTGVIGGILSAFIISFYEMILIAILIVPDITIFMIFLGLSLISGIVIGLIGGSLIATYYTYKEMKGETREEETLDDDFYDDLIEK